MNRYETTPCKTSTLVACETLTRTPDTTHRKKIEKFNSLTLTHMSVLDTDVCRSTELTANVRFTASTEKKEAAFYF